MNDRQYEKAFKGWRTSLRTLVSDAPGLAEWQERRFRFAHKIGELLTKPHGSSPETTGPVLYGVSIPGAGLCYVGQTLEAERRLRDLPVGESHHLANTLPPELWERVVVVRWPVLLAQASDAEQAAAEALGAAVCGLALEHRLQLVTSPPLNGRRRHRNGQWRPRDHAQSRSRGAVHAASLPGLWDMTWDAWRHLAGESASADHPFVTTSQAGRAVFPSAVLDDGGAA